MRKRIICISVLFIIMIFLCSIPILATEGYTANISVNNASSSSYTYLAVKLSQNNSGLISNSYTSTSTMLDVNISDNGTNIEFMPTDSYTFMVLPTIASGTIRSLLWSSGNTALTDFPIVVGYNGYVTIPQNASLELGSAFQIDWAGYIDATAGSNKDIVYKAEAFRLYLSSAGNLRAAFLTTGDTETNAVNMAVTTGDRVVSVTYDGTTLKIYLGGVLKDSSTFSASVPSNLNNWIILRNNIAPYTDYYKMYVSSVEVLNYKPVTLISGTTLVDTKGTQNGTFTFGSNPTDVTATWDSMVYNGDGTSTGSLSSISNLEGNNQDIAPVVGVTYFTTTPTVVSNFMTPVFNIFNLISKMTPDGLNNGTYEVPVYFFWLALFSLLIVGFMVLSLMFLPNQLVAAFVDIVLSVLAYKMGIYPFAVMLIIIATSLSLVIWERKQSL